MLPRHTYAPADGYAPGAQTAATIHCVRNVAAGRTPHANAPCALCATLAPLQKSHIIPKFVFRYMRTSSPGRIRDSTAPNRLIQDGPKIPLLCAPCEERFAAWETPFAERIFLPFHTGACGNAPVFRYQEW